MTTFIYRKDANACSRNDVPTFLPHPFSFLPNAIMNGTCMTNTTTGTAWSFYDAKVANITLCASNDGVTPYWINEIRFGIFHSVRTITWNTWVPGKPSSRYFVLPSACTARR